MEELAAANAVRIELDLSRSMFSTSVNNIARGAGMDPIRLALGWGDWQLVVTIPGPDWEAASGILAASGERLTVIGRVVEGTGVWLRVDGEMRRLSAPDSERFAADSWFMSGIDSYITRLVEQPFIV